MPELEDFAIGRVLQRDVLLKGRRSGTPFVAAESLVAIDLLPPAIMASLTETDRPIGEVVAASCIETFKEEAKVWAGELPGWPALDGYQNSRTRTVARRYRIIAGGQPVIIITEYFLRSVFQDAPREEPDRRQRSHDIDTRSGDRFVLNQRIPQKSLAPTMSGRRPRIRGSKVSIHSGVPGRSSNNAERKLGGTPGAARVGSGMD